MKSVLVTALLLLAQITVTTGVCEHEQLPSSFTDSTESMCEVYPLAGAQDGQPKPKAANMTIEFFEKKVGERYLSGMVIFPCSPSRADGRSRAQGYTIQSG